MLAASETGMPTYREQLKHDVEELAGVLELSELQKRLLRLRWMDQVYWLEGAADRNRLAYYAFRLVAVVGGVVIPALVSLNVADGVAAGIVRWSTFALSLLVAVSVAVEELFHFGDRWRHYRRTVEFLKAEGWLFLQRGGRYATFATLEQAFHEFAAQVESISQNEVEMYVTQVVRERQSRRTDGPAIVDAPSPADGRDHA